MSFAPARLLMPMQAALAVLALLAVALWPPSSGAILLIPLTGHDVDGVAKIAVAGGAMLLGPGPFRGSLVVIGDRASIARQIIGHRIVMTAAPSAGCGDGVRVVGAA